MGESTGSTQVEKTNTQDELSGSKVVAFIGVLILFAGSINAFQAGSNIFDILFGILAIILAIVVFISLGFIDLGPVKIPYLWYLILIIGIVLIGLAFPTTVPSPKPYLGGILIATAGIVEFLIQQQKREVVVSKFVAFAGAAFAIYESIMIFALVADGLAISGVGGFNVLNGIIGIIAAAILILLVYGKIDIKIPYNWWTVLILAFIIFNWVSPAYGGIAGTVTMVAFILIIIGF